MVSCLFVFVFISKHANTFSSTSLRLYLANICIPRDDGEAHSLLFTGPFLVRLSSNPQDVELSDVTCEISSHRGDDQSYERLFNPYPANVENTVSS